MPVIACQTLTTHTHIWTYKQSRAVMIEASKTLLKVVEYEGSKEELLTLLDWAHDQGFNTVEFLTFRKSFVILCADLLSKKEEWSGPEIAGYIVQVHKVKT